MPPLPLAQPITADEYRRAAELIHHHALHDCHSRGEYDADGHLADRFTIEACRLEQENA